METAEQELEALKEWWKENGRTVVIGVVLGLGSVFGWTSWQAHQRSQSEELSVSYQQIIDAATESRHDKVQELASSMAESAPKSGYAALGNLIAAKSAYEQNDLNSAKQLLDWVIQNADKTSVKDVARIRMARLLIQENNLDQALAIVGTVENSAFEPSVNEIRGDVAFIRGDMAGAREAYRRTLNAESVSAATRARVQMKIDDLGIGDEDQTTG